MSLTLTELPVLHEALPRPALARAVALPVLRLVPAPISEPPYDDELPGLPPAPSQAPLGPLALLASPLRLVRPLSFDDEDEPRHRTPLRDLPPAPPVARALVQGLLEVLAGVRPLAQLQAATSVELFAQLERVVHGRPRPPGPRPSSGAVRSVHVQELPDGVAEVCATVQRGERVTAIALRLEGLQGRWRCTDLVGV